MSKSSPLWVCPPRTQAKLEILKNYLGAWFSILANKGFRHVYYIDGFCGPGEYENGVEGSPLIAARLASSTAQKNPGFKATLIYVDNDPAAVKHLEEIFSKNKQHPNVNIQILSGLFSDQIDTILTMVGQNPASPTFSFIDPFGFGHSPFETIKRLMHNDSSEIFVNFWCGYMNRFKEHHEPEIVSKIKSMVGTDDLADIKQSSDTIAAFCDAFAENLGRVGPYILRFVMRDEKNIRDNAFFFCGRNPRGYEKIKEAMWKVDPIRGNSFSAYDEDSKNESQATLFAIEPYTYPLSKMIFEQFSGRQNVAVSQIFKWVIEETDTYIPKHARSELERLFETGKVTAIVDPKSPSRARRPHTWPERLLLTFACK